jgi:hypothetical protein
VADALAKLWLGDMWLGTKHPINIKDGSKKSGSPRISGYDTTLRE